MSAAAGSDLTELTRLVANPPYAAGIEEQRQWLRAVMGGLAVKGQPLAQAAGLAPSTINRFLAPRSRHRLRAQTLRAIAERATALLRERTPTTGRVQTDCTPLMLPCYALEELSGGDARSCAPLYRLPFCRGFLGTLKLADPIHLLLAEIGGDAMAPALGAGDQILVDTDPNRVLQDGLFLLAPKGGHPPLARRLTLDPDGDRVWVSMDNDAYLPPQVRPRNALSLLGRVVWVGRQV